MYRLAYVSALLALVMVLCLSKTTWSVLVRREMEAVQQRLQSSTGVERREEAQASSGMHIMSRAEMLAERRRVALSPLDNINEENAAVVLQDTAKRLQKLYEADIQDPKFGASMSTDDLTQFKTVVPELWSGLQGVQNEDLKDVTAEEGEAVVSLIRHLAQLTDDLSGDGRSREEVMRELNSVYAEAEPIMEAVE